jgi:hypothetical protein
VLESVKVLNTQMAMMVTAKGNDLSGAMKRLTKAHPDCNLGVLSINTIVKNGNSVGKSAFRPLIG